MIQMKLEILRCVNCGAPLTKSSDEFYTCEYCGYSQRVVDAERDMESFKAEVYNWIKNLIPDIALSTASTMDVAARQSIFRYNIRPKLVPEYSSIQMNYMKVSNHQLLPPPFIPFRYEFAVTGTSKEAFKRSAAIKSLEPMAVAERDRDFLKEVIGLYTAYAHLLNIIRSVNSGDWNYSILWNNFKSAYESLEGVKGRESDVSRFRALYYASLSADKLVSGDNSGAMESLEEASRNSSKALEGGLSSTSGSLMLPTIEVEAKVIESMKNMVDFSNIAFTTGIHAEESVVVMSHIFRGYYKGRINLYGEERREKIYDSDAYLGLSSEVKRIISAKSGLGTLPVTPGHGDMYVATWSVRITYTYERRELLSRKGVAETGKLLVPAVFPLTPRKYIFKPELLLTDVTTGKGGLGKMKVRTKVIEDLVSKAKDVSVQNNVKVVPPFASKEEVEKLTNYYMRKVIWKLQKKIKFGSVSAEKILYIPASYRQGFLEIPIQGLKPISIPNIPPECMI